VELIVKGQITLIDDADYEEVIKHTWNIGHEGYVINSKMRVTLHQFLLGKKDGFIIDHINRNKLDNRRSNLRHTTYLVNNQNRDSKGYTWDNDRQRWKVMITIGKEGKRHQRRFKTEEEAKQYAELMKQKRTDSLT
jgi:hypothetical protein